MIEGGVFEFIVDRIRLSGGKFEENTLKRTNLVKDLTLIKGSNSPKDWLAYKSGNQTNHTYNLYFKNDV